MAHFVWALSLRHSIQLTRTTEKTAIMTQSILLESRTSASGKVGVLFFITGDICLMRPSKVPIIEDGKILGYSSYLFKAIDSNTDSHCIKVCLAKQYTKITLPG